MPAGRRAWRKQARPLWNCGLCRDVMEISAACRPVNSQTADAPLGPPQLRETDQKGLITTRITMIAAAMPGTSFSIRSVLPVTRLSPRASRFA